MLYLDGVEETKHAGVRVVEGAEPLRKSLKTVHHGAIVTVGGGGDEEEDDPPVEGDEPLVVRPFPVRVEEMVEARVGATSRNSTGTHC